MFDTREDRILIREAARKETDMKKKETVKEGEEGRERE